MYRYQEFKDQLHNFNDHVLISLNLCLFLRSSLQVVIGRLATIVDLISMLYFNILFTVI